MRKSLIISAILHFGVLAFAVGIFPVPERLRTAEVKAVPVDLVTPSELTRIKAGLRDRKSAKPASAPAPKKNSRSPGKSKTKAKPRAVKAAAKPPARSKPKAAAKTAKVAPTPKPKKRSKKGPKKQPDKPALDRLVSKALDKVPPTKTKPRAAVKRTAKSRFSADRIAALLNKVPDAGSAPPAAPKAAPPLAAKGRPSGQDRKLTVSEIDALRARISQCWTPPTGVSGADALRVRLRLNLNRDGTLARQPEILNRGGSAYFRVAADSAVRAVWQCQPYRLPGAKYALWRDMVLNFDPREMFGG